MEPSIAASLLPDPAKFLEEFVGDWVTAAAQSGLGKSWGKISGHLRGTDLDTLLRNHDLRRVTYMAQCLATEAVCARWLDDRRAARQRARRGKLVPDWTALLTDADVRVVAWWLRIMAEEARRAQNSKDDELEQLFGIQGDVLRDVVVAGSEILSRPSAEVAAELTKDWLATLERFHESHLAKRPISELEHAANAAGWVSGRQLGLPSTLRTRLDHEWFNIACAAFRELIKGDKFPKARRALELDLLSYTGECVSLLESKLDDAAQLSDANWRAHATRLAELGDELKGIATSIDALADGVRLGSESLDRTIDEMLRAFTGQLVPLGIYESGYWSLQARALDLAVGDHAKADDLKAIVHQQLVGRSDWLESFEGFLFDAAHRSYVLHGHTGTGKSRVALAAAALAAEAGFQVVFLRQPSRDIADRIQPWFAIGRKVLEAPNRRVLVIWDNCDGLNEDAMRAVLQLHEDPALLGYGFDVRVLLTCWPNVGLHVRRAMVSNALRVEELRPLEPSAELAAFVTRVNPDAGRFALSELLERSEGSIELLLSVLSAINHTTEELPNPSAILHDRYQRFISNALDNLPHADVRLDVTQVKRALRRAAAINWQRDGQSVVTQEEWGALERLGLAGPSRDSLGLSIIRAAIHGNERGWGRLWLDDPKRDWPNELEPLLLSHVDAILVRSVAALKGDEASDIEGLCEAIFERVESCVARDLESAADVEGLGMRRRVFAERIYSLSYSLPQYANRAAKAIRPIYRVSADAEIAYLLAGTLAAATVREVSPAECHARAMEIGAILAAYPSLEIATSQAMALRNATVGETAQAECRARAAGIGALLVMYPSPEIALWQAQALCNTAGWEASPTERRARAAEIGSLLAAYPSPEIALTQAQALYNATVGETSQAECQTRAAEIGTLLAAYPSVEIALQQAKTLCKAAVVVNSPVECRALAAEIGTLLAAYPSREIALQQALVLCQATFEETSPAECQARAAEIGTLLAVYPSSEIALLQATALAMPIVCEISPAERRARAADIGKLFAAYPSQEIAFLQAEALYNASAYETSTAECRALASEIGMLLATYPSREIALRQAKALYNATVHETIPAQRRARATEIGVLLTSYPSPEIALVQALALCSTTNKWSTSQVESLKAEIVSLSERFEHPGFAEILTIFDLAEQ